MASSFTPPLPHLHHTATPVGGGDNSSIPFKIASYNLGGLQGQGHVVLSELCSKTNNMGVIFLQEHWLTPEKMAQIINFSPFFTTFGISAMEEKISHGILMGRPFGGAATMVHRELMRVTTSLLCTERVSAVRVDKLLLINVYLPTKSSDNRSLTDLLLNERCVLISMNSDCSIVVGGTLIWTSKMILPIQDPYINLWTLTN